jgi:organic hydroperoxide reductase OsmC/OhrA
MSEHKAIVRWRHTQGDFLRGRYSREHTWSFDGGLTIPASPSPGVVPVPLSNPASVDPEEAFVAAISSCHMLSFLYLACRGGFAVLSYEDDAVGTMRKNERGVPWVSSVQLRPSVVYAAGNAPTSAEEDRLHYSAHEECFIANSVRTEITVQARARP